MGEQITELARYALVTFNLSHINYVGAEVEPTVGAFDTHGRWCGGVLVDGPYSPARGRRGGGRGYRTASGVKSRGGGGMCRHVDVARMFHGVCPVLLLIWVWVWVIYSIPMIKYSPNSLVPINLRSP